MISLDELSVMINVPKTTILRNANKLGLLQKRIKKGTFKYFTTEHYIILKDWFDSRKVDPTPEIIYVTRTTEIYQSKLNFLTLEQL